MIFRPVLYITGTLMQVLAISMAMPFALCIADSHSDWRAFFIGMIVTAFMGGLLVLSNSIKGDMSISVKQSFIVTSLSWLVLALCASLPFALSASHMSYTDSFFEAMSGLTTTGSTVIADLENVSRGILLWRAILQWLGGIGIIVMAISVLPFLRVGGMQLFRTESSENEKVLPRTTSLAISTGSVYLSLTCLCAFCYMIAGMGSFDAIAHSMTTIATGGFSTFNESFAGYNTPWIEIVAIVFMILGSLPFVVYLKMINGNLSAIAKDPQVRLFLMIISCAVILMIIYLLARGSSYLEALRLASFNVVSIISGTGYVNGDYGMWGGFAVALMFFLMFMGGCAGSSSCGIKVFRFHVLYEVTATQIKQLLQPSAVFVPSYNGKKLSENVQMSVMSFFFVYILCFAVMSVLLSCTGLDFITALSGSATAISNVGPALGEIIGPAGNFYSLPDSSKWILSAGMLLGRLEIFTVLILLMPGFWRK